jgi:nucleotide-binding universal stress UspA family protein
MIRKILVPVDGSKVSRKAAHYAVELAKDTGASVMLLSVIDTRFIVSQAVSASASPTHVRESIEDYLNQSVRSSADDLAKLCMKKRVRCKVAVRSGHPVEEIVGEAKKARADLIVMGSRGRSALRAAVLGSVAYGVMHKDSKIPVLIVRR